jgi:hypothetical protein
VEWIDIEKVTRSQSFRVPDTDRLKALIKNLKIKIRTRQVFVMADMSVFHHLKKASDLLEYENHFT